MPNIATVFKEEISRIARKEQRAETAAVKKAVATHRGEIAALKRRLQALEKALKRVAKTRTAATPAAADAESPKAIRFSAKGLLSQRKRLGLSAHDCGLLVGASSQSIYNWEDGKARPRAANLSAIAALKTLGKKEAAARLEALR